MRRRIRLHLHEKFPQVSNYLWCSIDSSWCYVSADLAYSEFIVTFIALYDFPPYLTRFHGFLWWSDGVVIAFSEFMVLI